MGEESSRSSCSSSTSAAKSFTCDYSSIHSSFAITCHTCACYTSIIPSGHSTGDTTKYTTHSRSIDIIPLLCPDMGNTLEELQALLQLLIAWKGMVLQNLMVLHLYVKGAGEGNVKHPNHLHMMIIQLTPVLKT